MDGAGQASALDSITMLRDSKTWLSVIKLSRTTVSYLSSSSAFLQQIVPADAVV